MFLRSDGKWVEIVIDSAETDNTSLEKVDGVLSIAGFKDAPEGTQPIKNEDGSLSWIKPDLTTIEALQNDVKNIEQILNPTDDEGNPIEGGLASDVEDLKENVGKSAKYDEEGTLIAAATGLYAELDKKANAAEIEEALNSKVDIIEVNEALDLKADSAVVEEALDLKANIADVYTKTEADSAIATAIANVDHLSREIVSVLPDAANANPNIIYMVPSGLQEDDNKYYEWILIDGTFEQVGSWEVDLKAYAKAAEVEEALNGKVDKDGDSRLMTQSEGAKLASVEENAEKNIINSISADFEILSDDTHDRELILKPIAITKITDLEDRLNNKVDKEAGWTLLSPTDQQKLARLSVDEESGDVGISATVNVENVQGLEDWLNKNASVLPGLSENNFNDTFKQKLEQQLLIKSVETTQLDVTNGHLSVKAVEMNKIAGLNDVLALKANVEQVNTLATTVGSLQQSLNDYNARVDTIEDRLTWQGLT